MAILYRSVPAVQYVIIATQLSATGKVISEVMSVIFDSQKSFVAFYTSDSSLASGPQIQVFEYKREAEVLSDVGDSSASSGTVCALVRTSNSTGSKPCAMMCLTPPISVVTLGSSGSAPDVVMEGDNTVEFGGG